MTMVPWEGTLNGQPAKGIMSIEYAEKIGATLSPEFIRGWNAALDAVLAHCEEVREDRRTHPPTFRDGRRKMTPEDIVLIERTTVGSIKCRTESLRKSEKHKE